MPGPRWFVKARPIPQQGTVASRRDPAAIHLALPARPRPHAESLRRHAPLHAPPHSPRAARGLVPRRCFHSGPPHYVPQRPSPLSSPVIWLPASAPLLPFPCLSQLLTPGGACTGGTPTAIGRPRASSSRATGRTKLSIQAASPATAARSAPAGLQAS
jgi:hypothetical protein